MGQEGVRVLDEEKDRGVIDAWYSLAADQRMETLPEFLRGLLERYEHDYGTICHAVAAGAVGTVHAMNREPDGGLTGFQMNYVMWQFIRQTMKQGNKTGMALVDYDNMLYPQYEDRFDKVISLRTFTNLQEEAKYLLRNRTDVHPEVRLHWESIVTGKVPFGYRIKED